MNLRLRSIAIAIAVAALICLQAVLAPRARAGGFEYTTAGTHALGRGAYYARVRDFMAVWQNPANLAITPRTNVGLHGRLPIFNGCFEREKNPDVEYATDDEFREVCNGGSIVPTGSLGFSMPIRDDWGFGFGVFTPTSIADLKFGPNTIFTKTPVTEADLDEQQVDPTLPSDDVRPPSPARWMMLDRLALSAFFMAGVGYEPIPQLRFGLSAGFGFATIDFRNASAVQPGELSTEVLTDIQVSDGFIPRLTGSVASTPIPGLDLSATFTWTDDIKASGHADFLANGFRGDIERRDCRTPNDPSGDGLLGPGPRCRVDDVQLDVPFQRAQLMLAARYGMLRPGADPAGDPMDTEVFDVEINAYWEQTSHVEDFLLDLYDIEEDVPPAINFDTAPSGVRRSPLPPRARLKHDWDDTYGVRVGGDYNVLPGFLALRGGLGFETAAAQEPTMSVDYWPVQRVVLHLGATVRVGSFDVHLAYAHSFNQDMRVDVGQGEVRQVIALTEDGRPDTEGRGGIVVNEGKYSSRIDVLAAALVYNF